jgi:fibronectin-binding autotransporter adhesin
MKRAFTAIPNAFALFLIAIFRSAGRAILCACALVFISRAAPNDALAQTWTGNGANNNFSTAANWSPVAIPANNGTANLTFSGANRLAPNIDTPWAVSSLSFATSAGAFAIGGQTLTIGSGGITLRQQFSYEQINVPVQLVASQTWNDMSQLSDGYTVGGPINLNGFNLTLAASSTGKGGPLGNIVGTGNITVTGGQYDLWGTNTFTGAINLNGGVIDILDPSNLSAATTPLKFNGGQLFFQPSVNATIPQNGFIASGGGTLSNASPQGVTTTFSGNFSGLGALHILTNNGNIALSGTNTYSGGTTIGPSSMLFTTTSSLPGNVTLLDDAHGFGTLNFQQGFDGTFSGSIGGSGYVVKYGAGNVSFPSTISAAASKAVNLAIREGRFTMTGGNNALSSVALSVESGFFDLNDTNQVVLKLTGTGQGGIALGSGTLTFGDSVSLNYGATISGAGGITKVGTGTEDFYTGAFTYTGPTRVNGGTLLVERPIASNGSNEVFVSAGVDFSSASMNRLVAGPLAGFGSTASGNAAGLLGASADLRAGQYSGTHTGYVNMQWRVRTANETGIGHGGLISDVMNLAGIPLSSSSGDHLQSGPYVLEMAYSPARLGVSESGSAASGLIYLAWLNTGAGPPPGIWQKATSGNFGTGSAGDVFPNAQSSWDSFASSHQITESNLGNFLGSYGVDIANHRAWAVINYDASYFNTSQFAVVPEPSTLLLVVIGAAACGVAVLRRKRSSSRSEP